jgi:amidophosphoribosyltransferase
MTVDEIKQVLGADSLAYLDVENFETTLGRAAGKVCMACMTGNYPLPVPNDKLVITSPHPLISQTMTSV